VTTFDPATQVLALPEAAQRLRGKVAVVSGAGSIGSGIGNGRAISCLFARHGAVVALIDIDHSGARETEAMILAEGGRTMCFDADVTDDGAVAQVVDAVVKAQGRIDVLVNVVGVLGPQNSAVDVDLKEFEATMRTNVMSMVHTVRHVEPVMAQGGGGSIINFSSIAGLRANSTLLAYNTTKAAIINMTRSMAIDHGADGVRVNCLAPGLVFTPNAVLAQGGMPPELRDRRSRLNAMQREGSPWDVAAAALFLASDEASWITGVVLPVDGGLSAKERGSDN
jgi:NAD(P)-dependent dehydrogenase (short-subunit alcohol dehydrogenase family)